MAYRNSNQSDNETPKWKRALEVAALIATICGTVFAGVALYLLL